jgi:3'(2'), 5'-bisphosphate nucleotidase
MQFDALWNELTRDLLTAFRGYRSHLSGLQIATKADTTLLTEADIAVERLIVEKIRKLDPDAVIVGEEDGRTTPREDVLRSPNLVWVVDPIDGTAEFVRPDRVEFCSVVCVLKDLRPIAAFVVAPELGRNRQPVSITADQVKRQVVVNGSIIDTSSGPPTALHASVTRSSGTPPRPFEDKLLDAGYQLKTRTTSQTLDMIRTAVDIDPLTGGGFPRFTLFHRTRQKMWDGLAGLCVGDTVGLWGVDANGRERLPVTAEALSHPEPTFDVTIMGPPREVRWFLEMT